MNQFPYENLSDEEFEALVICICKEILGIGCKTFSIGKDSGKDSWFMGTAQYFPSKTEPWKGTFNIQAKHTKEFNASCSDNDFSVNQSSILHKEIKRLKEVRVDTPFDNYILFTNRKLSGGAHTIIVELLCTIGISKVEIVGREQLDTYLTDYPKIAYQFGLHKFIAPLRFYEKDIQNVIIAFAQATGYVSSTQKNAITTFEVIDKAQKNKLNQLSSNYFDFIQSHSLHYFEDIEHFLQNPINAEFARMYANTISDLQHKITISRTQFHEFEYIIDHLTDYLIENNRQELQDIRSLVRVFIHFMYFNCDIGKTA